MAQCYRPFRVTVGDRPVPVPCGSCPFCLKRKASHWALRLDNHIKDKGRVFFVTLTYENPPISPNGFMTLDKRVFQLFMKRLRKYEKKSRLSYYAVGEYGGVTHRPHYHVILYGLQDYIFIGVDNDGYDTFHSKSIESAWCDFHGNNSVKFGFVQIRGVKNNEAIKYCTKYITKGRCIPMFDKDDRLKEFALMSKKLGLNYITEKTLRWHKSDLTRFYHTVEGGYKVSMPRYYRDKIFTKEEREIHEGLVYENGIDDYLKNKDHFDYLESVESYIEDVKAMEFNFQRKARERNKI